MRKIIVALVIIACLVTSLLSVNYFKQSEKALNVDTGLATKIVNQGNYRQFIPAKPVAPFVLQQLDSEFSNQDLLGKWTFVIFGYTFCPDVCPTTLTRVKSVLPALQKLANVQVAFVSADPLRDTPERLFQYVNYFDSSFLGLTAAHDKLFPFAQALYLPYGIISVKKSDNYAVSHSASIALINPKGEYTAQFIPQNIPGEVPTVDMKTMVTSFEKIITQD